MDQELFLELLRGLLRTKKAVEAFLKEHSELSIDSNDDRMSLLRLAQAKPRKKKASKAASGVETRRRMPPRDMTRILHTAKTLALCSLPYERTEKTTLVRKAVLEDGTHVHVKFSTHDEAVGIPFGKDRALITWLMTMARDQNTPRVQFQSALEFINAFGIANNGRNYHEFRQSMERICNVTITYGYENRKENADRDQGEKLVYDKNLPLQSDYKAESRGLRSLPGIRDPYYVEFGTKTFQDLVTNPVSVPLPILKRYQNQPTAWDFLQLVSYEAAVLEEGQQKALPLEQVISFLGSTEQNPRKIRQKLDGILNELGDFLPNVRLIGRGASTVVVIEGVAKEIETRVTPVNTLGMEAFLDGELLPKGE